jgi:hypothetical protein
MFTPIVIESRSALEAVCRDPFLEDPDEAPQHTAPAADRGPHRRSQRALVEAALLRMPGPAEPTSRRA